MCIFIGYKLFKDCSKKDSCIVKQEISNITNKNYSNILQAVHNDIDSYIGKKIKYSGFVYRVYDLDKEQFILGRNMIISSDFQTVVVGFLCHYKDAISLRDSMWLEIEGTIKKGTYHNLDMPFLEITSVREIDKPNDEYVYPPNENYIPTFNIL